LGGQFIPAIDGQGYWLSYNLKNLKRVTLIGETTGGGAHPGGVRIATERFMVWIPSGRAINPITKTDIELKHRH
jgi:hypothetical protein